MRRTCEWLDLPPCDPVLSPDPLTLPDHVCLRTMRATTEQFVIKNAISPPLHQSLLYRWSRTWPLPIGKQALLAWFRGLLKSAIAPALPPEISNVVTPEWKRVLDAYLDQEQRFIIERHPPAFLTEQQRRRLAPHRVQELPTPLAGHEIAWIGLILERRTPTGGVVLYGPIEQQNGYETFVDPILDIKRGDRSEETERVSKTLTRWYSGTLLGISLRGRRFGSREHSPEEMRGLYRDAVLKEYGAQQGNTPSLRAVADRLGMHRDTLRNYRTDPTYDLPSPREELRRAGY